MESAVVLTSRLVDCNRVFFFLSVLFLATAKVFDESKYGEDILFLL